MTRLALEWSTDGEPFGVDTLTLGSVASRPEDIDPPPISERVEYYHLDVLGSVRAVTDAQGHVVARHDFLPFGEEWFDADTAPGANRSDVRLFTAKERDVELDLDYFGARYYRRDLGRFTSVDPVGLTPERMVNPQDANPYTYVANSPLVFVDHQGGYKAWMHEIITATLLKMSGFGDNSAAVARFAGNRPGGADSFKFGAMNPVNWCTGTAYSLHFPSSDQITTALSNLVGDLRANRSDAAGHEMHAVEDGLGAHAPYAGLGVFGMIGHTFKSVLSWFGLADDPDAVIGDDKFVNMANSLYQSLTGNPSAQLTPDQLKNLIDELVKGSVARAQPIVLKILEVPATK